MEPMNPVAILEICIFVGCNYHKLKTTLEDKPFSAVVTCLCAAVSNFVVVYEGKIFCY